ncbi:Uncharacterised protein [Brevibacterium casei]|uniref:Uncharacterized protein n=1 Tax=Brevibacterium casei TaxID=33889 RepID=A0A449D7W8_9MICO|nr:hypothetical protein [Brevibacterium casei]VEW13538.1 Uncharacterised protein [Brevibacterium casei]
MTCDPYTPDETELRDCYAASLREHAGEDYTTAKADAERGIAKIKADALREIADMAITIPDVLGYKVNAVAVEDLLDRADMIEGEA